MRITRPSTVLCFGARGLSSFYYWGSWLEGTQADVAGSRPLPRRSRWATRFKIGGSVKFIMKVCPRCGFSNPDEAIYCARCGYPLSGYTAQQGTSYGIQGPVQPGPSQATPQPNPTPSPDTAAKSTERKALLQLSKGVNYFWEE